MDKKSWLEAARWNAEMFYLGSEKNPRMSPANWWINGEIRVFWTRNVPEKTVDVVVSACEERAREFGRLCGFPAFRFRRFGSHPSALEQVAACMTIRGEVDEQKFFPLVGAESWRRPEAGGYRHGDIYITEYPIKGGHTSWGVTSVNEGIMLLGLYGDRPQSPYFLDCVAMHEMGHMLGIPLHCDQYRDVAGYRYDPHCGMHWACPGTEVCPKCLDFVSEWWRTWLDMRKGSRERT
ncbi:MAG: hypothetical protein COV07_02920 [Candidatus Vogelbacteria bacterium CG10_big_fil_rev_8_21_14_0_10_45_14]|uniref:Peptidase M10 metallopeptidase domain-containing protein n=1 Tax=Candidatus Vogelbacteria bacterium CG10_big_fil_rev_8_21_14_0_10_45_14 TaxID=1975042 RepID=A0A2H0RJR7_9BACT|nr:MAG: hypothetical protein COV07_02920 [Candidatus Vogelbacteria bacterium CG10_big_fil_rev_8_21_14_0_10_45_14]